jgi:hypothetical protein
MRFGSVCSGIEAASAAWNPLGWEAAWFSLDNGSRWRDNKDHEPETPIQATQWLSRFGWSESRSTDCAAPIGSGYGRTLALEVPVLLCGQGRCVRQIAQPDTEERRHTVVRLSPQGNCCEAQPNGMEQRKDLRHSSSEWRRACLHPEALLVQGCVASKGQYVRSLRLGCCQLRCSPSHPSQPGRAIHHKQRCGVVPELSSRAPRKGVTR